MNAQADNTDQLAQHLLNLEKTLLDPAVRLNRDRVAVLLSHDFVEFGSSGRMWTREQILDQLASEEFTAPTLENFECCQITESIALVTYRTLRTNAETGEAVATLRSSLWSLQSGAWLLRFHQGTPAL